MNININGMNFRNNNHQYRQGPMIVHVVRKPRQIAFICFLFIIIGFITLIFGTNLTNNDDYENFVETSAKVVDYNYDNEGLAAIVVEYTVDNVRYESVSNYKTNNPKPMGSYVEIKYNPENPKQVYWNDKTSTFIIIFISSVFIIVGVTGCVNAIKYGTINGFNSGTNTTIRYDEFGNMISNDLNGPSRFDYSNQNNQNINNPYAMNNNYSDSNQNMSNNYGSNDSYSNFNNNNQNINNPYETNNNYSNLNQNNIDQNNNNF